MKNDRLSLAFACLCVPTGRSLRSLLSSVNGSSQTHFAIQPLFLVYEFTEVPRERSTTHIALSQHRSCLSSNRQERAMPVWTQSAIRRQTIRGHCEQQQQQQQQ